MRSKRLIPLRNLSFLVILLFWTTVAASGTAFADHGVAVAGFSVPTAWYVNVATGNDSNDGKSPGTPFKWITRAMGGGVVIGVAIAGDTINVAPGTYPWALPPC